MGAQIKVSVFEVLGSQLCIATDDGQKVHDRIAAALREDHKVVVSFANITSLTSAFLNAAIGQLYGEFSEAQIKSSLQISDLEPDDINLLRRVVKTAKMYFNDPERFSNARRLALEEDTDDE